MKSVMAHSFSQVPKANIPRSSFNRSHGHKTTFDADYLVPILVDDIIPGDTFNVNCSFVVRLSSPMTYPIMDNLYLETFFFFVPYRLLWENWERFCGSQDDPGDSISFTIPVIDGATNIGEGNLGDYMGLPINQSGNSLVDASALPFRAYHLIWDEWFRDENLQDASWKDGRFGADYGGNGPDGNSVAGYGGAPLKRGKRHDYFTSCLPWPQKGDAVDLPLGTVAPVVGEGTATPTFDHGTGTSSLQYTTTGNNVYTAGAGTDLSALVWNDTALEADLTSATAATINELRLAFQTQRLLERDARSGTRYVETILAHFGVVVPDFRVQRPEFLGGGSSRINVNQVQNNSGSSGDLGDLGAFGIVADTHGFTKSFVVHGVLLGLVNVRGDITYSQGLERYWRKSTRYDFYYPVLSQIGEQSVLNSEIWFSAVPATDDAVFGYQERYAEYRYKPSRLSGDMRPDSAASLAAWNLSEDFASLPTLDDTFIQSNTSTPLDRAVAVPGEDHFIGDFYFDMKCARPMPLYGVPGNLDHF